MTLKPMLAVDSKEKPPRVPDGDTDWIQEPKLDGMRVLIEAGAKDGRVRVYGGRNGVEHTGDPGMEPIIEALRDLEPGTILDGELVAEGGEDANVMSALSGTLRGRAYHLKVWVFDLPQIGTNDLSTTGWRARRHILERRVADRFDGANVELVPYVWPPSTDLHEAWLEGGLEGSVVKRRESPYKRGSRSSAWRKVKPQSTAEAVVVGYVMGKGKSNGHKVGAVQIELLETGQETSTGWEGTPEEAQTMVGHVIEVAHHGWTEYGKLRHPVFLRMRPDRDRKAA